MMFMNVAFTTGLLAAGRLSGVGRVSHLIGWNNAVPCTWFVLARDELKCVGPFICEQLSS